MNSTVNNLRQMPAQTRKTLNLLTSIRFTFYSSASRFTHHVSPPPPVTSGNPSVTVGNRW